MKEIGQIALQLQPEIKKMVVETTKTLRVGQGKLVNACLLHGLLDLNLNSVGEVKFR